MTVPPARSSSPRPPRLVTPSPRTGTRSGLTPTAPWYASLQSRRSTQPLTAILHPPTIQLTYLAQCPGSTCTGVNANSLKWFKIDEAGLLSGTIGDGYWGAGKMIDQNSSWTTTVPASVPSGNYLIRFETIALHSLPAQFYPECAQIQITNGGSRQPTADELVSFPGAYSNSDPGCTFLDFLWMCAGDQGTLMWLTVYSDRRPLHRAGDDPDQLHHPRTPSLRQRHWFPCSSPHRMSLSRFPFALSEGLIPRIAQSTVVVPTGPSSTSAPPTQSSAPAGTVAQYGQCGGQGYSGPTACISPYTCKAQNGTPPFLALQCGCSRSRPRSLPVAYYSQCL